MVDPLQVAIGNFKAYFFGVRHSLLQIAVDFSELHDFIGECFNFFFVAVLNFLELMIQCPLVVQQLTNLSALFGDLRFLGRGQLPQIALGILLGGDGGIDLCPHSAE